MTEADWLSATDPEPMLEFMQGKTSDRKLRLFACACCRRNWEQFTKEHSRQAVEIAEMLADETANCDQLHAAHQNAIHATEEARLEQDIDGWHTGQAACLVSRVRIDAWQAGYWALGASFASDETIAAACCLVRDIFGNPFCAAPFDFAWSTYNVQQLTHAIYEGRAFDRMPILGDALEDAGCTNADILDHCRQPGEHARGCWVLDLLLAKS